MYNIAIVDDKRSHAEMIKQWLYEAGLKEGEACFDAFSSGEAFVDSFRKDKSYDLLIMDMQLDIHGRKMDGLTAARRFTEVYPYAIVVFYSGVYESDNESYNTGAFRYLKKQDGDKTRERELRAVLAELKKNRPEPFIPARYYGNLVLLHPNDIVYIKIDQRGTRIFTQFKEPGGFKVPRYLSDETLDGFYKTLAPFFFARPHKSHIVNMRYVVGVRGTKLRLRDGGELNISERYSEEFKLAFVAYGKNKYELLGG